MTSYKDIIAQIEALKQQAEDIRQVELSSAIAEIKDKMAEFGITIEDLEGKKSLKPRKGQVVAAKYRDSETGAEWTGRGREPRWMAEAIANGKNREDFLIR